MRHIPSAARIARKIRQTEAAMDQTILHANALVTAIIEARIEGKFAAEVGQDALDKIVRGIWQMTAARGAIVAGHSELAKIADDLAIEWRMDGPLEEKIKELPSSKVKERDAA
jgi:hypothetical protein